ncbi:MAG: YbaB/EbfC family nucleoid-associated protein [Coriobacteriia bacterium]|nr:YbaB/EbfC family nucleoid-associated protein [Coriobacteriia bacterium]
MDMRKMMKEAQKMQKEMEKAQDEIALLTAEASSGGGIVKAVAQGEGLLTSITIDPAALDGGDVEMLEDMVLAAANDALRKVAELANIRMSAVTGGLNIPGL